MGRGFLLLAVGLWLCGAGMAGSDPLVEVPPSQIDLGRDTMKMSRESERAFARFETDTPPRGGLAPDFTLKSVSGREVTLSSFRGRKPVVLVFGSASCFVFRRHAMPLVERLKRELARIGAEQEIEIFEIYTLEAHPAGEPSPYTGHQWTSSANVEDRVLVRQPGDEKARRAHATALVTRYHLDADHLLVDGMGNTVWKRYGCLPDDLFLLDRDGKIVFKERWAFQTPSVSGARPAFVDALLALLGRGAGGRTFQ